MAQRGPWGAFRQAPVARGGRGRRGRGGAVPGGRGGAAVPGGRGGAAVPGGRGGAVPGGRGGGAVPGGRGRGGRRGRGRGASRHDPWQGGNQNQKPKPIQMAECETKVYKVKESELTGDEKTDALIEDYIASFNKIQEERRTYLDLYSAGADDWELEGQMKVIQKLIKKSKKLQRPIQHGGGIPRDHPSHFNRTPK